VLDLFQVAVAVLGRLGEHLFLGWKMVVFMYLLLFCTEFAVERGVQHVATHHVLAVVYDFLPPAVAQGSRPPLEDRLSCANKIILDLPQVGNVLICLCSLLFVYGGNFLQFS
jgi:hypothetical protein